MHQHGIKQFITLGQCHVVSSLIKYSRLISNAVPGAEAAAQWKTKKDTTVA